MKLSCPRSLLALAGACALALAGTTGARTDALTPREEALHVLNRLGFGPRPGDVERVLAMGPANWVAAQLHPERISDAAVEAKLARLETLTLSNAELIARFEVPFREAKKKLKAERAAMEKEGDEGAADDARGSLRKLIPPESRPRRILDELTSARILRGAESQRQLNEVLVDFWMNHFNVYANKGAGRVAITSFERDTIRPRIWGKFEDLLLATAASPAMLAYLDNARSVADEAHRPARMSRPGADAKAPRGLNENYARELMELHTLGVDGGYSQTDVTELARILTGWSVALPRGGVEKAAFRRPAEETAQPGAFVFRPRLHDADTKTLLATTFPAGGGMEEGERAIRLLARHPSTARHIAFRLCQRLVADEPAPALVERVAARFSSTGGNLRETVRAVVESPEFFDPKYYRAKVKSPFEYAVSAVRAGGGSTDGRAIAKQIADMGQPLYLCQPPTGYADTADAWVNSGALLARLNFAIALAEGRIPGTSAGPVVASHAPAQELARALAGSDLSAETLEAIRARAGDAGEEALAAGLVLGSPEFQRQ